METRICKKCKEEKPLDLDNFRCERRLKNNKFSYRYACIPCENKFRSFVAKLAKANPRPSNYQCPICLKVEDEVKKWACDHDHQTDKFRGWLCNSCNTGLGILGDSIENLARSVLYLKENGDDPLRNS